MRLSVDEALEGAPEIAYAASLAIQGAAAAAVESLQAGGALEAAADRELEEKKGAGDVVFARRTRLARLVRQREIDMMRMLRVSAMEVAAAAMEEEEGESDNDEDDEDDDGEEQEEKRAINAVDAPSSGERKRAAAPPSEEKKRKKRGD